MNKGFKVLGIITLLCFSFYYTHQFALLMQKKDPIYQNILLIKDEKKLDEVEAVIMGDYIIPGLKGKTVNVSKSFQKMKSVGAFLEPYIVYDDVEPKISLATNKDKIITKANFLKMGVAFIVPENSPLIAYLEQMDMDYAMLTTKNSVLKNIKGEKINNDEKNYNYVDKQLSKQNENNNICYLKELTKEFCLKKSKILVKETKILTNQNIAGNINKIDNGSILYLDNIDVAYLKLLIQNIVYKGYTILPLSQLISENR